MRFDLEGINPPHSALPFEHMLLAIGGIEKERQRRLEHMSDLGRVGDQRKAFSQQPPNVFPKQTTGACFPH